MLGVLINPKSGKHHLNRQRLYLMRQLNDRKLDFTTRDTQYAGHATELAREFAEAQTLTAQEHVVQVHAFYYDKENNSVSVDVVPDFSITNDEEFISLLSKQLNAAVPGIPISIVIDHNFCD